MWHVGNAKRVAGGGGMRRRLNCRGNVFVEYFIVAAAMALAVLAVWNGGNLGGVRNAAQAAFNSAMGSLAP